MVEGDLATEGLRLQMCLLSWLQQVLQRCAVTAGDPSTHATCAQHSYSRLPWILMQEASFKVSLIALLDLCPTRLPR